ncbi:MAG: hypothetical protein LAT84_07760 [Balneolia bacterium]|nr:hypothetical protein [Balneolia bacterium]
MFALFKEGLEQIAFPTTCVGCGDILSGQENLLCEPCITTRFDDPNPANADTCGGLILPDEVSFQDAMWLYDKESVLQTIMRMLKYEGMAETGQMLGRLAAERISKRHLATRIPLAEEVILLPVPIHKRRKTKRGYNQARLIAEGIAELLDVQVLPADVVVRVKHTVTQTKFNFDKRMQNLKQAFELRKPEQIEGRHVIIIDDVFTTGSTCFTLSSVIAPAGPASVGIFTIGMA